jgi:hypothetical protein
MLLTEMPYFDCVQIYTRHSDYNGKCVSRGNFVKMVLKWSAPLQPKVVTILLWYVAGTLLMATLTL